MATAVSTYLNRKTPGVYITEQSAFGTSIVGVDTAVPVFVGYTECAGDPKTGKPLYNQVVAISSLAEYVACFGGPSPQSYAITALPAPTTTTGDQSGKAATPPPTASFYANYTGTGTTGTTLTGFTLASTAQAGKPAQFNLYWQMQLFFANGGGDCFVVSCGSYWTGKLPAASPQPVPGDWLLGSISKDDLLTGLGAAEYAVGATMTVVPEACQLVAVNAADNTMNADDYGAVAQEMLAQASRLQDRVAILDLPGCMTADSFDELTALQTAFWNEIAPSIASASYGAAYAPAVHASVIDPSDVPYSYLVDAKGNNAVLNNILTTQATALYAAGQLDAVKTAIGVAYPATGTGVSPAPTPPADGATAPPKLTDTPAGRQTLNNLLFNALPVYGQIMQQIADKLNVAPPSGIMAGVWTKSDALRGVWNAPANMALAGVASPLYTMSDAEQAGFNMPTNGVAVDVIRAQPSRGNVVWGARTLDGNSQDYRYIQVRRTLIYIEQSVKLALKSFVFAPNDATTWTTVTAAVGGFLTGLWQQGGLMGSKPEEAFGVLCGLGSTMTPQNVLDGYMIVAVTLQMIHPAEFIELTFTQKMGS